jgi:hypothetical protein
MIDFLEFIHIFKLFYIAACNIEVDIPFVSIIQLLKTIEFKRIHYALILWACDFIK